MNKNTSDQLIIGKQVYSSRLLIGTGKYSTFEQMTASLEASGAQIVTVALRRVNFNDKTKNLLKYIDTKKYQILPNTAGCYTANEAIRYARLARELNIGNMIKIEVIGDQKTLFPDNEATIQAAKTLIKEDFIVLPYVTDDPITAKKLEDIGCAAVMPLAAPIGSGLGLSNPYNIQIIREMVKIPVIVDAGVGTASDAAIVMELGCDAVLMNTGIAQATHPHIMAKAMRYAIEAGRLAYLAGRIPKKLYAQASSPIEGMIQ